MFLRRIVPAVQDSVHAEMLGLKAQLPGTMHESVKSLQENMERSLGTMVQRAVVPAVQQAVSHQSRRGRVDEPKCRTPGKEWKTDVETRLTGRSR